MKPLTDRQQRCLDALATYEYLTTAHMVRLGLGSTAGHVIERVLKGLRPETNDLPQRSGSRSRAGSGLSARSHLRTGSHLRARHCLVDRLQFGSLVGVGRLHDLYYLTKYGAQCVAQSHQIDPARIRRPTTTPQFKRDYHHRVAFIDAHIALVAWARQHQHRIVSFRRYFDFINRVPETRIKMNTNSLIPDGILRTVSASGTHSNFFVEIHLGNRPGEVIKQISAYRPILTHHKNTYLLSLFEQDRTRQTVRRRLNENPINAHILTFTLEVFQHQFSVNSTQLKSAAQSILHEGVF